MSERVKLQNCQQVRQGAKYCLYWLRDCLRVKSNFSLNHAIQQANAAKLPLVAVYLYDPDAHNDRQRIFLLEGLIYLRSKLSQIAGLQLHVHKCQKRTAVDFLLRKFVPGASEIVTDHAYLRDDRTLLEQLNEKLVPLHCRLTTVETNVVVPVQVASSNSEFAARTFRPKVWQHAPRFLKTSLDPPNAKSAIVSKVSAVLPSPPQELNLDEELSAERSNFKRSKLSTLIGGEDEAKKRLEAFITGSLLHYADERSNPGLDRLSHLSPYLHFGMISPIDVIAGVETSKAKKPNKDAYIEELLVRRELSFNFVWFERDTYDSLNCIPDWAKLTLKEHKGDQRVRIYDYHQLEEGRTHDPYWNASQLEMVNKGKMHGYMRMYWAKKVIEWTDSYETAYHFLMEQNDRYQMDGRDPNGFAGVIWNFGKHDRAHAERAVFGKLRYMNLEGLRRKYKKPLEDYVDQNGGRTAQNADDNAKDGEKQGAGDGSPQVKKKKKHA